MLGRVHRSRPHLETRVIYRGRKERLLAKNSYKNQESAMRAAVYTMAEDDDATHTKSSGSPSPPLARHRRRCRRRGRRRRDVTVRIIVTDVIIAETRRRHTSCVARAERSLTIISWTTPTTRAFPAPTPALMIRTIVRGCAIAGWKLELWFSGIWQYYVRIWNS